MIGIVGKQGVGKSTILSHFAPQPDQVYTHSIYTLPYLFFLCELRYSLRNLAINFYYQGIEQKVLICT